MSDIESGRTTPNVATIERLLRAVGSELVVTRAVPPACAHLERYLTLSLTTRLFVALGGRTWPDPPQAWQQLWSLGRLGTVQLVGAAAAGVWTPDVVDRPRVRVFTTPGRAVDLPEPPSAVDVDLVSGAPPRHLVPIRFSGRFPGRPVHVQDPDALSQTDVTPEQRVALRAAAALLDADAGRDDADRRAPAHRQVSRSTDQRKVMHTRSFGALPFPPEKDARGWRVGGPVSLAQWLRRHGYPT